MIVLDTNVVSAMMLAAPDLAVASWLDHQARGDVWLTSVTVFEIQFGLATMPEGQRLQQRQQAFAHIHEDDLQGRVLPFDTLAAMRAAEFTAMRRMAGRPVEFRDAEIAGIVSARNAILATRNIRDFEGFGIDLVNPWEA